MLRIPSAMLRRNKLLALLVALLTASVVVMALGHFSLLDGSGTVAPGRRRTKTLFADAPVGEVHIERAPPPVEMSLHGDERLMKSFNAMKGAAVAKVNFIPSNKRVDSADEGSEIDMSKMDPIPDSDLPDTSPDGTRYIPRRRVVHLDLKGAPPKLTYFKNLFPLFASAGATTVLIEYEDMFPFKGDIRNISAHNAYSESDVSKIVSYANANGLEVIPLVQTFGHLEMALKLDEFKTLREAAGHPQDICPSQEGSWRLITAIIDQVAALHPSSRFLHIGCDEVFHLASCPLCSDVLRRANEDPKATQYHDGKTIFLDHVLRLGKYVRLQKRKIPIVWDDMFRSIPGQTLVDSGIGNYVEPMVWVYVSDIDRFVDPLAWAGLGEAFRHVWTASAFKGAFGERLYAVNVQRHVANNLAWLDVMRRESEGGYKINFRGMVITGWSRYDHFAVLCELLPAAIPSLVLNLAVVSAGAHTVDASKKANRLLLCDAAVELMSPEALARNSNQWEMYRCRYPGSSFLGALASYDMTRKEVEAAEEKVTRTDGWMTDYNVRHRFSSARRVSEAMRGVHYLSGALRSMVQQFKDVLSTYFDEWTVEEWIEQHLLPLQETVSELNKRARTLTRDMNVWPRRPLEKSEQLQKNSDGGVLSGSDRVEK